MWKFGWCLATKELRRRRRQFTNAIWIPFSMPALNLMCPGSKSEIALLMFKWWILTLLVGMNLLGKFFWHVSIIIFIFSFKKYIVCTVPIWGFCEKNHCRKTMSLSLIYLLRKVCYFLKRVLTLFLVWLLLVIYLKNVFLILKPLIIIF